MKEKINVFEKAPEILENLRKGVLLTTKAGDRVNTMTIGWGTLGIEWAKPIFTVYVRQHRFTHEQLSKNPEFTVNVPVEAFNRSILGKAGTLSGHDGDKIEKLGLTLEDPEVISVPGIKELPLTLECRVLFQKEQKLSDLPKDINDEFYPQNVDGTFHMANRDSHTAYYAEIVAAYIIK
ncbi:MULTISPECIES: flavin reductase family protein [Megasphaera]|uniref:flavin reductase family protein n=1 Tax=Megasphaera TaxID=906 RepID=UPI0004197B58|nr:MULTISPECIES: flavin reductase family protein [Megasphaera]MBS6257018.1 flavin reductase family protein [Megasphaera sp.]MCQ5211250.1 flavin reductase family protein [Megasphaera massiliensis]MEE0657498.1 flavin reductase family protein [Megasphaera massiliensis]OBZ32428.1 conserved protein/domain typically associated with flavoprotein oxygenase, DIM6/NTAB family [Megasphaera sp. DISK 18]